MPTSPVKHQAFPLVLLTSLCALGCVEDLPAPQPGSISQAVKSAAEGHHYLHEEEQAHNAVWGYDGSIGPAKWGSLCPEYAVATTGREQSPIDLGDARDAELPDLEFHYLPAKIDLVYNGHTIQEQEEKGSYLIVGDRRYELKQFHFHSPSEHTRGGLHTAMEMHLVHQAEDGEFAVIALLIEQGLENKTFGSFWGELPTKDIREVRFSKTIDAAKLLPADHRYYTYGGSFTTPPCTEGVRWFVLSALVELSEQQIDRFRVTIHGNNRPTQPIHSREVLYKAR